MPSLWSIKKKEFEEKALKEANERRNPYKRWGRNLLYLTVIFLFINPEYIKRIIYPPIYGTPIDIKLDTSSPETYIDTPEGKPFKIIRKNKTYTLIPKTKYSITGRIGYVDKYDTFFNRLYRGHSQEDYINIVPSDLFIVRGNLAKPEVYNLFYFTHEERSGSILCKGVKYKESFFSFFSSKEEYLNSKKNYDICKKYENPEENNNYHPIPANSTIKKALSMLLPNDVVYLEGILVDVRELGLNTGTRKKQYHKYLTNGYNPGMCFILYTTKIIFNNTVYE